MVMWTVYLIETVCQVEVLNVVANWTKMGKTKQTSQKEEAGKNLP